MSDDLKQFDLEIAELKKQLAEKVDARRNLVRRSKATSAGGKRGRPRIPDTTIEKAWRLAADYPLSRVADILQIGRTTLKDQGITRGKAIERERRRLAA